MMRRKDEGPIQDAVQRGNPAKAAGYIARSTVGLLCIIVMLVFVFPEAVTKPTYGQAGGDTDCPGGIGHAHGPGEACPGFEAECTDEVTYSGTAHLTALGTPPAYVHGDPITATIFYQYGDCCGGEHAPEGYDEHLAATVTPTAVGTHQNGTATAQGICGDLVTAATGAYTVVDVWFEDEFGKKITYLRVPENGDAQAHVVVEPQGYADVNLFPNGSGITLDGNAPGSIEVGVSTNNGNIQAAIYSGGPVASTLSVVPVQRDLTIHHTNPDHNGGPFVIINDTGHYDGEFWADEYIPSGEHWTNSPRYWKQTGVNGNKTKNITSYFTNFVPDYAIAGSNELEVLYTINGTSTTISRTIDFETSPETISAPSAGTPVQFHPLAQQVVGGFKNTQTTGDLPVALTTSGTSTTSWSDSTTTAYTVQATATQGHSIALGGAIALKALEISAGQTFSGSASLMTSIENARTIASSGASSASLQFAADYSVPPGDTVVVWVQYYATTQEIAATYWPDANQDGVADGPAVSQTWTARSNPVPIVEPEIMTIP